MTVTLQTLDANARDIGTAILAALDTDAGVVVRNFIDAELLQRLRADIDAALAEVPWCNTHAAYPDSFFGRRTKRLHGVVGISEAAAALFLHPLALSMARRLLGERLLLSTAEVMAIGPGETRQALHRDADSWHRSGLTGERELLFSVNLALTDFTADNGATVVLPGSHTIPRSKADDAAVAYAEMPAGAALLYTGRVLHGGGGNRTDATRIGLYYGYVPSWLRPLENPYATVTTQCLERLERPLAELLGVVPGGFAADL